MLIVDITRSRNGLRIVCHAMIAFQLDAETVKDERGRQWFSRAGMLGSYPWDMVRCWDLCSGFSGETIGS